MDFLHIDEIRFPEVHLYNPDKKYGDPTAFAHHSLHTMVDRVSQ